MKLYLKKIVYLLIGWLDTLLQLIAPVSAHRLCYTSYPDYTGNAYHLYRHALQTRNNLQHVWLLRYDPDTATRITQEFHAITAAASTTGNSLRICERRSLRGYWLFLTSRNVFHTNFMYGFTRHCLKRNIVGLWHGMPVKRIGYLCDDAPKPAPTLSTMYIAPSSFYRYIIAHAFHCRPEAVFICQQPRCDVLVDPTKCSLGKAEIHARLDLPLDKKLILWLPTFREEGFDEASHRSKTRSFLDDLHQDQLVALDDAARMANATVLLKPHPHDYLNGMRPDPGLSHIRVLQATEWGQLGIHLYDLMAASDAFISDITSAFIDYLLTGRPIGIMGIPPESYSRGLIYPIDYFLRSNRFQQLKDAESCKRFMDSIGKPPAGDQQKNDIATIFNDHNDPCGSETLLRHLEL